MDMRLGFYWLKKCTGISELFCYFLTLGGQPLPIMSEKSPFVRAGCFSESHTIPIYYTKDKGLGKDYSSLQIFNISVNAR